jgi:predicted component of type VI protein secretion system
MGQKMRAQLIPLEGGETIEILKDLTLVGRKEECDLRLDHKSVSKLHCVITRTDGLLFIRDLGSTNGTRVNGQRVRRAALLPNDQLTIASFKFRVHFGPDAPSVVAPDEHTQHLDARDVAHLMRKPSAPASDESSGEVPIVPVQANALPDVYPDDKKG